MAFNPNIPGYSTQGKSFSRTAAFPLESYEIWTDYEALVAYAANTDAAKDPSYIGQKVAYIDTKNNRVVHYGIEIDGTLKELGADLLGVEALAAADHGKIPKAFWVVDSEAIGEEGAEDYQPEIGHVEIKWVADVTTTVGSVDGSITIIDNGVDGNHAYDLSVNFPEIEVPAYAIQKLDTPTEGSEATYALTKDGEILEDKIEIPLIKSGNGAIVIGADEPHKITLTLGTDQTNALADNGLLNLAAENSILRISDNGLYATVDLEYRKVNVAPEGAAPIYEYGIYLNNTKVIDASDFVKDGFLNDVTYDKETNQLTFIWNTDAGKQNLVVDLGEIIRDVIVPRYAIEKDNTITNTITYHLTADGERVAEPIKVAVNNSTTVDLSVTNDDTITANVNISTTEDNILTTKNDGLYVSSSTIAALIPEPLTIEGENAIQVVDGTEADNSDKIVKLVINNEGHNVTLYQDESGLSADVEIPEVTIPDIVIGSEVAETAPGANTASVIASLSANGHTIHPTTIDVVTKAAWDAITADSGKRLITEEEINKLSQLTLEEGGGVAISGTINATNVHGLGTEVVEIVTGTGSYVSTPAIGTEGEDNYVPATIISKLGIEKGAQVNKIEAIALPDAVLAINNKQVDIPAFVAGKYGAIKGAEDTAEGAVQINKVYANDGVGEVHAISTDILVQGTITLILDGGNANVTA